jgi:CheY-like chemotaxis protein
MAKLILVADDDDPTRRMYVTALQRFGYATAEAASGAAAINSAQSLHPALVLLDIGLGDIEGWEVCHEIQKNPATRDIKIMILTGRPFLDTDPRLCNPAGFATKPASPKRVIDEIVRLIGTPDA